MEQHLEILKEVYEKKKEEISTRLKTFEKNSYLTKEEKFVELCFCILVAGNPLERTLKIWKSIGRNFLTLEEEALRKKLRDLGYRFYNIRSSFIVRNRAKIYLLENIQCSENFRDILVENFHGIGYKEASHFLRNVGCKNFAIIDRHVLTFLKKFNLIGEIPKSLNKKKYLYIESILRKIAEKLEISLAELDFCIFYFQTGKFPDK